VTLSAPIAQGLLNPTMSPGAATSAGTTGLLTLCRHDGIDEPLRGQIQAYDRSGYERTLNVVPLQTYLDGVVPAEESASWGTFGGSIGAPQGQAWGFQALEAQAVAARSYALAYAAAGGWSGYATICDTTNCQAYVGASYETAVSNLAVSDTAGLVLATPSTQGVISARYSASTGGWTAPGNFPAVRDRGDVCVVPGIAAQCNPNHSWQQSFSGAAIARHFRSVGTLLRVRVTSRNGLGNYGGRVLAVLIVGTKGRITVTGSAFAAALNLRSDWFAIGGVKKTRILSSATTS
jgi:SpoIID/LytB domain protein